MLVHAVQLLRCATYSRHLEIVKPHIFSFRFLQGERRRVQNFVPPDAAQPAVIPKEALRWTERAPALLCMAAPESSLVKAKVVLLGEGTKNRFARALTVIISWSKHHHASGQLLTPHALSVFAEPFLCSRPLAWSCRLCWLRFPLPRVLAGRVGKTSILLRYCKNAYEDKQVSTLQAAFLDKRLTIGKQVRIGVAGEEGGGGGGCRRLPPGGCVESCEAAAHGF